MFPNVQQTILDALKLIDSTPNYSITAGRLGALAVQYNPSLPDRAITSIDRRIFLGPNAFATDFPAVGVAGTLVHEEFHTRQNPFLKTLSFWSGVFTRTPVMARYEWPAYREQVVFLRALGKARPDLQPHVQREIEAVIASVHRYYGRPPYEL